MQMNTSPRTPRILAGALGAAVAAALVTAPAHAALTAYYTLDNATTGITNQGTDGSTSNLALYTGSDAASTTGIIGNALRFDGTQIYYIQSSTNAAADLSDYPFTLSIWIANVTDDAASDAAIGITQRYASTRNNYSVGISATETLEADRWTSNTHYTTTTSSPSLTGATWHNIAAVYGSSSSLALYLDGKLATIDTTSQGNFSDLIDAITIGGAVIRNNAASPFKGDLDDAGLFNTALNGSDVALINGLGRTGAIGLDQLAAAQALNAASLGATADIGGATWQRVDGLPGVTGDFGGTVTGGNAFIVTDDSGNGIALVPEPATITLLSAGMLMLLRRRHA